MTPWTHEVRWLLAALLLAPVFASQGSWPALPRTWEGDEPHYLVMVHSIIQDGDLDLANNYAAVYAGGSQAGRRFSGQPLDNHSAWYKGGERILWREAFHVDSRRWGRDAYGHPVPTRRTGVVADTTGLPERPLHPWGLPLLLSALVWPLRGTALVESACVLLAGLAMLGSFFVFLHLARRFSPKGTVVLAATGTAFLGTPLWHYSRSIFNETFLTLFALSAYALVLRGRPSPWRGLAAGFVVGLGILMKPPFALIALPLVAYAAYRRAHAASLALIAPCILSAAAVLVGNALLHGSAWTSAQPFPVGNPIHGALGLLFDLRHGLLPFAPVLLLALAGWPALLRATPAEGRALLAGASLYFAVMSFWAFWWGGWCYGPRLILPIVPLLMLGAVSWSGWVSKRPWVRAATAVLVLVSVGLNARFAFSYWRSYRDAPFFFGPDAPAWSVSRVSAVMSDGAIANSRPRRGVRDASSGGDESNGEAVVTRRASGWSTASDGGTRNFA